MNKKYLLALGIASVSLAALCGTAMSAQDRYTLKVPDGLAFAEFRGYEKWQVHLRIEPDRGRGRRGRRQSRDDRGFPGRCSGQQASLSRMAPRWRRSTGHRRRARMHRLSTTVPGSLHDIDFMVRDSKRFPTASVGSTLSSSTTPHAIRSSPTEPRANCGVACHTIVKSKDYVFTAYPKR